MHDSYILNIRMSYFNLFKFPSFPTPHTHEAEAGETNNKRLPPPPHSALQRHVMLSTLNCRIRIPTLPPSSNDPQLRPPKWLRLINTRMVMSNNRPNNSTSNTPLINNHSIMRRLPTGITRHTKPSGQRPTVALLVRTTLWSWRDSSISVFQSLSLS